MPNRVVREKIIKSELVNKLSWAAEVFYRRLMSVVDDFGLYDARPSLLRTDLFGLRINKVPESDVVKWMNECSEAGLIRLYTVDGKTYLEILQFNQTIRLKKSKYPSPPSNLGNAAQMISNDTHPLIGRMSGEGTNPIQSGEGFGDVITPAPVSVFPGTPKFIDLPALPQDRAQLILERQYQLGYKDVNIQDVVAYWSIWAAIEITGDKYYQSANDVYKHFFNRCQQIRIEKEKPKQEKNEQPPQHKPVNIDKYSVRKQH